MAPSHGYGQRSVGINNNKIITMEKLFTIEELAEVLQLNKQTVQRFVRENKIKAIKVGREYRVKQYDLDTFLHLSTNKIDEQV